MADQDELKEAELEAEIFHDLYQLSLEKRLREVLGPVFVELRESAKKVNPTNPQKTYAMLLELAKDTAKEIFDDLGRRTETKKQ